MAIDEKKLIEDVEKLKKIDEIELARCLGFMFGNETTATIRIKERIHAFKTILNTINVQPKLSLETKTSDKDVPDTNVGKINREFEKLEVAYFPDELCTYPEYIGKPYFAIRYKENGNHFVGYGTYKPEVLSRYLRDYFMPSADSQSPKWIPCSEMLPDVWKSVLVTSGHLGVPDIRIAFVNENLEWASIWSSCEPDILAWMPLPDAYKGE